VFTEGDAPGFEQRVTNISRMMIEKTLASFGTSTAVPRLNVGRGQL
jgi:hypothetical protein